MAYKFSDRVIRLPKHDNDLKIVLPNGITVTLQYRVEGPSLDVLLSEPMPTIAWEDFDMTPARFRANGKATKTAQVVFSLPVQQ